MSTVQTAPPRPSARTRPVAEVAMLALVAALFVLLFWLVRPPPRVDHVDIVNRSTSELEVSVAPAGGGGELGLAEALPRTTTRVEDVIDQGDDWVFRISTARCPPIDVPVSRAQLAADGWRFAVPDRVTEALASECVYQPPVAAPSS
jgi:hypothetical protein